MIFEAVRQQQSTVDRIVALGSPESDCAFYRFLFSATLCTIWHWSEWQNNVPKESFQQISLGFSTEKASYIAVTSRPFSPVLMLLYKLVLCQFRLGSPFFLALFLFTLLQLVVNTTTNLETSISALADSVSFSAPAPNYTWFLPPRVSFFPWSFG